MKNLITTILFFIFSSLAIAQSTLDSGLVAYLPLNGNTIDVTGNGYDGTINGNATLVPDRFNSPDRAFTFPEQASCISLANSVNLNLETGFTINSWVKYKFNSSLRVIVCKHVCGFVNGFLFVIDNDGQIAFYLGHSGWSIIRTYQAFVNDQWYMLTATYDAGAGVAKIFVNGELAGSGNVAYNNFSSNPISIGEAYQNNCIAGNMNGAVDEVKIYNRPLTNAEILEEYNNTYSDLVLFLPFNENANDESGSGNNGTVNGATLTQDRFGVNNKAYQFDGVNDYISIADNPNLFSDELTISWWYKLTETPGGAWVVIGWIDGGHRYQQFFSGNQLAYFNGYNLNAPGLYFNPTYDLNELNVWKHIVVTYKKLSASTSTTSIYVDGELTQTDNHTLAMDYAPGIEFKIGKNVNGNYFKGYLDDFRIYRRILDSTEIVALYNDSTTYLPPLIASVYPHPNSNNFTKDESVKIFFSESMDESTFTLNNIFVNGNLTGKYDRNLIYNSSSNTLEIQPTVPFKNGEQITVTLDSSIQSLNGRHLSPYVFQFNVKPEKGSVKFAVADSFQLNFSPTNIVSGDFNNDGKVDLIVSNYDSLKYTVLLNNGAGGFTLGEEMSGEFKPYSISFTDIDNDRDLDMIVSTNEENKIRLLRGTGQGTFTYILPTIDVNTPVATLPGDFDGDGDNDFVAFLNYAFNNARAYLYKNDGTGSFTQSGFVYIGFPASKRNVVGDFDNDGDLDIVVGQSEYTAAVRTLINDGNGNFTYYSGSNYGPYPDELAGGDIDGDFDLDIIFCSWNQNGLIIMLNNSTGSFTNYLNLGNVGGQSRNPVVNDFDGDGDLDFVVNFNNNNLGIVKNNGYPAFEFNLSYPLSGLKGIAAADFDNNGSIDLVGISSTKNQIVFLKNCVDSLVAYFPFDNNTKDFSGNINDGINYNGVFDKDRYGFDNSSIYFDGVDSYIEGVNPGNNLPIGNSPRSFTAWIKNNQYNQYGSNIFHYGTAQAAPTNFHFLITDVLGLGNGYGFGVVYGNTNLNDSTWHFVAGVYEGGTERISKLFIDGKLDASGTISTVPNTIPGTNWRIGRFMEGNTNFNGNIDELKVYDISLTDQQIWNMYKATTTAPTLLFPGNDSTLINPTSTLVLDWDSTITATSYRLLISNDSLFNTVVYDTIVTVSSFDFDNWSTINIDNIYWKVRTNNDGGVGPWSEVSKFRILLTDVEDEQQLPTQFALMQNYPNPFNPSTKIRYSIPSSTEYYSVPLNVTLKVYDILGNEVATLVNEEKPAGSYEVEFQSTVGNRQLASGIYYYQLKAGNYIQTKKMIMLK